MSSRPGQAASLLFNLSVLLVAATSVAFGLDWMRAPLPPMPETEASVQAAKLAAHLPSPCAVTVVAKAAPRSVYPTRPSAPDGNAVAAVNPTAQGQQVPAVAAPEPAAVQTPAEQSKCDIAACSAAYHSFRASDCTWQPFDGPRRLCDKGTLPQSETSAEPAATPDATPVSDQCDVAACQRAYFTFNTADCTYQPSNGARRLCDKGHPPQKTALAEPATPTAPAAPATPADSAQVSNKCDVEACKQAYFTFNPADCTYRPSDGPRRLCTKGTPPKPQAALTPPAASGPPPDVVPPPVAATPPPAAAAPPSNVVPPSAPPPSTPPPLAPTPAQSPPPNSEPPKQEAAVPPAAAPVVPLAPAPVVPPASAPTAPADTAAPPAPAPPAAASAPVPDKCDVEACKRAYYTFNAADCTYKPSSGPRRLCTKGAPSKPQAAAPANSQAATPPRDAPKRTAPDHLVPPGLVPSGR